MHIDEIREEAITHAAATRVLLSTEDLFFFLTDGLALEKVAQLLGKTEVRVVVYLRRQDEWVESMYAESVTGGAFRLGIGFPEYAAKIAAAPDGMPIVEWAGARINLHFDQWLGRLRTFFGPGAVAVRTFEDARATGDLFNDFLESCGIGGTDHLVNADPRAANTSFGDRADIELVRVFNGRTFDSKEHYRRFLHLYEAYVRAQRPTSRHVFFGAQARRDFMDGFASTNTRVAREFLNRGELFSQAVDEDSMQQAETIPVERLQKADEFYEAARTGVQP